jgi:putative FmdB family regulatory protein
MPLYISIDIRCESCQHQWDETVERAELDGLTRKCPECEGEAKRTMSAPALKKVSYHDGYRRGEKYQMLKEMSKLKAQKANLNDSGRNEISKEIANIQRVASTKKDKTE